MMEKELRELESILRAEQKLFGIYLEKLIEQQRYLIENDLKGLKDSIEKISLLAQEAMTLENGRKNVIARISEKLKVDENDITLSKLLDRFKGHKFQELEHLRDAILDTHVKATAQRERNELLINQSMNVIGRTVNYLNERKNPRVTYDNPTGKNGVASDNRGLLVRTA
ncbi:MAG: flagellar protein FlgN [Candidatus Zixiibacteriota bacterium]|nr:MAG: flagellar protein FlgN [candidate division Zixibacteria bacterium]